MQPTLRFGGRGVAGATTRRSKSFLVPRPAAGFFSKTNRLPFLPSFSAMLLLHCKIAISMLSGGVSPA
jgi:hypothetical protein